MAATAVLDANVLLPIALADVLLNLADDGHYRPLWTDRILTETERAAVSIGRGDIGKRIKVMSSYFPQAMVRGWEPLVDELELPDPDDRHVLAAAIVGKADVIVTDNRKDFPSSRLPPGLRVLSADEFLLGIFWMTSRP